MCGYRAAFTKNSDIIEKPVDFRRADVSDPASLETAFLAKWPQEVENLPLTVIHNAATIRFWERKADFLFRSTIVNIGGVENALTCSKAAGATIFISTSSAAIDIEECNFWIRP